MDFTNQPITLREWLKPLAGYVMEAPKYVRASLDGWTVVSTATSTGETLHVADLAWTGTMPLHLDGHVSASVVAGIKVQAAPRQTVRIFMYKDDGAVLSRPRLV